MGGLRQAAHRALLQSRRTGSSGIGGRRRGRPERVGQIATDWTLPGLPTLSVVDCVFRSEDELLLIDCGYGTDAKVLAQATWDDAARGQLPSVSRSGETRALLSALHCPMGVCLDPRGEAIVSLLERATIVDAGGRVRQAGYPGYAARLRRIGSGYALACLSRRDPLIEFPKTERGFVAEMKATIDPRH